MKRWFVSCDATTYAHQSETGHSKVGLQASENPNWPTATYGRYHK